MVAEAQHGEGLSECRVVRPAFRVNWRQTVGFFAGLSVVTLSVAITFSVLGYWPILPFAGLELSALGVALYVSARRSLDVQVVRLVGSRLYIEKGRRRPERCWSFERAWAEVVVLDDVRRWYPCHVLIRSQGETVEIGEFLDHEARRELAAELKRWIGPMASAAPAPGRQTSAGG